MSPSARRKIKVKQHTQAALREVIGNSEMDYVLTEREQIAESIKKIVDAETMDIFVSTCAGLGIDSMIDTLGVDNPLNVVMKLKKPPDVVILHLGLAEEGPRGKVIQNRHNNRLRSKFDVIISAAGGADLKEARSAILNGANIVVVNLVRPGDPWESISTEYYVGDMAQHFSETIE
jgi:3-keto-L-gulonate-6-phosphate decarboxylase